MSNEAGLPALVAQIREASENIASGDAATARRFEKHEAAINELYKAAHRPGGFAPDDFTRKDSAIEFCKSRRAATTPRIEGNVAPDYTPSYDEINEATLATKAQHELFRHGDVTRLSTECRKSLSSFSFGGNSFLLAPEMSREVISCVVDPTDLAGLMDQVSISAGSIRYQIDNARWDYAGWACDSSCFANQSNPDLTEGIGWLEIKVEPLRYLVCVTRDLLADALFPVESWILGKVADAFRRTINNTIIAGDGVGKMMGILTPQAGIPICDTSAATQPGQFSWADLLQLKYDIPMEWQGTKGPLRCWQR
jgi:HK97 family phage major capsid protein